MPMMDVSVRITMLLSMSRISSEKTTSGVGWSASNSTRIVRSSPVLMYGTLLSPEYTRCTERNRTGRSASGTESVASAVGIAGTATRVGVGHRHARALRHQALAEDARGLAGLALAHQVAVTEHHAPVADAAHRVGRVGHDEDRPALLLELLDPADALALEALVAHGQDLVDHQDVGVHVHGDRKAQAARTCPRSRTSPARR